MWLGFASSAVLLGWQSAGLATYVLGKAVEVRLFTVAVSPDDNLSRFLLLFSLFLSQAWYFQLAREGLLPLLPHGELLVFALSGR